jgi:hypothetical protein
MPAPAPPGTWTVTARQIPWEAASSRGPVLPLGRNVHHDSRNLAYPWRHSGRRLTSQLWARHGAILDQADLGSCTGNAETGALECDPCFAALPAAHPALDEDLAVRIYSLATSLDPFPGTYPPTDTGSDGPDAAKAAKSLGLISGYLHCLSLADVLDALEQHPAIIGLNWYDSMDQPSSSGLVTISPGASVRGGHEVLCRGKDDSARVLLLDNSWGTGWGKAGSFSMGYATLDRLLHEQGDATISLPLSVTPPGPVPPVPPGPDTNPDDIALALAVRGWSAGHHTGSNARAAAAFRAWLAAKGL